MDLALTSPSEYQLLKSAVNLLVNNIQNYHLLLHSQHFTLFFNCVGQKVILINIDRVTKSCFSSGGWNGNAFIFGLKKIFKTINTAISWRY